MHFCKHRGPESSKVKDMVIAAIRADGNDDEASIWHALIEHLPLFMRVLDDTDAVAALVV